MSIVISCSIASVVPFAMQICRPFRGVRACYPLIDVTRALIGPCAYADMRVFTRRRLVSGGGQGRSSSRSLFLPPPPFCL